MTLWQMLMALRGIEDRADFHPERDQLNHTVQVALAAARETHDPLLLCAAILHDVGKAVTFPARGNAHGHDAESARMIESHVGPEVAWLVEQHIRVCSYLSGEMRAGKAKELAIHPLFPQLIQLRRFDVAGRKAGFVLSADARERFVSLCRQVGIDVGWSWE